MTQEFYEAAGVVASGRLKMEGRVAFDQALRRIGDGPVIVRVSKQRMTRSRTQNNYWWGVVVPAFSEHCGYDAEEMHEVLKVQLLPQQREWTDPETGEVTTITFGRSTASLTTKEFSDLVERAQRLGASMGIDIPSPGECAA